MRTKFLLCIFFTKKSISGQNYGYGNIRKNELFASCKILGIDESSITIIKHSLLPDSMARVWPAELIAGLISNQVEMYDIDTVITFDKGGVSKHVNHTSIYYAVANLTLEKKLPESKCISYIEYTNDMLNYFN